MKAAEIYEALFDDEVLARLPGALARAGRARSGMMFWRHLDGYTDTTAYSHYDPAMMRAYAEGWGLEDPWTNRAVQAAPPNQLLLLHDYVSPLEYDRGFFFNEFVRKHHDDTFYCLGEIVSSPWGAGVVSVQRGRREAPFTDEDRRRLQATSRHVERVVRARGEMAAAKRQTEYAERSLNGLTMAAITVDAEANVLHLNAAAEMVLRRADGLSIRRGRLTCKSMAAERRLDLAIRRATDPTEPCADAVFIDRDGDHPAYLATVTPLVGRSRAGTAVLFFRDPEAAEGEAALFLRRLFGLTPSEAGVALDVAAGQSLADIARDRGVAISTVRSQMKAIVGKTGCHRQTELAALVARLPPTGPAPRASDTAFPANGG